MSLALSPPHPAPALRRARPWPEILVATLAIAIPVIIGVLKIGAMTSWRYTSDIFSHDAMIQETLRGHFMMNFAYGNEFGDHAYLIYLLLVPVKLLIDQRMIFLTALLTPITFGVCGLIVFACLRAIADARTAACVTTLYFFSAGAIAGPFEPVLGFHVDTLSGFVAVAMVALLMRHELHPTRSSAIAGIAAMCVFALLKEEMALLGAIFFAVLLMLPPRRRDRIHVTGLVVGIAVFALDLLLIRLCKTPWNRGNGTLLKIMAAQIHEFGLRQFLFPRESLAYWLTLVGMLAVLGTCIYVAGRANRYAIALALTALAKLAFAWTLSDFEPFSWHNYPAMFMLTGAIALQSVEFRHAPQSQWGRLAMAALLMLSIGCFVIREIPHAIGHHKSNAVAAADRNRFRASLLDVMSKIDPLKVTSVPRNTAYEWSRAGYRYAFFPRGISDPPQGVADFLVIRQNEPQPVGDALKVFTLIYQNRRYRLYQRSGFLPDEETNRKEFVKRFGRDAIGIAPKTQGKKKPAKKK